MASASFLASVVLVAHAHLSVAVDPSCMPGGVGCTADVDDSSSLLAMRAAEPEGRRRRRRKPDDHPGAKECISTPEGWFAAFNAGTVGCVSPALFGVVEFDDKASLFPDRTLAFLSGNANLENFLSIRSGFLQAYNQGKLTKEQAELRTNASFPVIVGFPRNSIPNLNAFFTVFALPPPSTTAVVPSWEQLFFLCEGFGLREVPFHVQRDLTLAYAQGRNPIESFSAVAGCNVELVTELVLGSNPEVTSILDADCYPSFITAIEKTGTLDPFDDDARNPQGLACFQNFEEAAIKGEITVNATTVRAVFFVCIDASPLFSATGLGFNNVASPLEPGPASPGGSYTGREFVSPNLPINTVNQVTQPLTILEETDGNLDFLETGFWSGLTPPRFRATAEYGSFA